MDSSLRGNDKPRRWIPAFAGMTGKEQAQGVGTADITSDNGRMNA